MARNKLACIKVTIMLINFYFNYIVSPFGSVSILTSNLPVLTNFGSNVSKSCIADGGPNNTFEWTNDQGEVVSNSSQLQLTSITGSDAGTYTCNVTNAAGSGADEVTVTGNIVNSHA